MNSFTIEVRPSEFITDPHPQFVIDGISLDERLHAIRDGDNLLGLVPAFDFLYDATEREIACRALENTADGCHRIPLLICPDDLDFHCTTIVVESVSAETEVSWQRIGLSVSSSAEPSQVCDEVQWYENVPALRFARSEYEAAIEQLRLSISNR